MQTVALPLGYAASKKMERETGFEPATSTLARSHSTAELFPLNVIIYFRKIARLVKGKKRISVGGFWGLLVQEPVNSRFFSFFPKNN